MILPSAKFAIKMLQVETEVMIQKIINLVLGQSRYHLNSIGVATKLASIMLGAWQRFPNNAIAIPQRKNVVPVNKRRNEHLHE